jgi:hypothetical protein
VQSNSEIDSEAEAEKAEKAVFPMGRGMSANGAKKPGSAFKDKDVVGWELGGKKRVTLSTYRGKTYVGLREYYEKDGRVRYPWTWCVESNDSYYREKRD